MVRLVKAVKRDAIDRQVIGGLDVNRGEGNERVFRLDVILNVGRCKFLREIVPLDSGGAQAVDRVDKIASDDQ